MQAILTPGKHNVFFPFQFSEIFSHPTKNFLILILLHYNKFSALSEHRHFQQQKEEKQSLTPSG
jgi:hypothetical protein